MADESQEPKISWRRLDFTAAELLKAMITLGPVLATLIALLIQGALYRTKIDWAVKELVRIEVFLKMPIADPPGALNSNEPSLGKAQKPQVGSN